MKPSWHGWREDSGLQMNLKLTGVAACLLLLAACGGETVRDSAETATGQNADASATAGSKPGTVLVFHEKEPDNEAHRVVFFVNADFMRINDWKEVDDFILFDRQQNTIFNVVKKDRTVLVIKPRTVDIKSPLPYELHETKEKSAATVKSVNGSDAYHYSYLIGDRVCYDTVSLDGYLDEVVAAIKEFRTVLAGEHAKTIGNTPVEMLDACDLAMNIFEPNRYLEKGFPLREWDGRGYQRFLVDVRGGIVADPELLKLPEGYQQYEIKMPTSP